MGKIRYASRLLGHLWAFALQNKAYWLVPLVLILFLLTLVIAAGQTTSPFIYTLW